MALLVVRDGCVPDFQKKSPLAAMPVVIEQGQKTEGNETKRVCYLLPAITLPADLLPSWILEEKVFILTTVKSLAVFEFVA